MLIGDVYSGKDSSIPSPSNPELTMTRTCQFLHLAGDQMARFLTHSVGGDGDGHGHRKLMEMVMVMVLASLVAKRHARGNM